MRPFAARPLTPACYALGCALAVAGGVAVFRERMGTQHLSIHVLAVVLAVGYALVARPEGGEGPLGMLGLSWPRSTRWIWVMVALGVVSGAVRLALYRATGLGGIRLYEEAFVPLLRGDSAAESVVRHALFLVGLYAAVVVPGVLFWAVVQGALARAGWLSVALVVQSGVFGYCHCYMTGSFDLVYGAEAFVGSFVSGLAYARLKNVYVPALLMWASVATSTLLARAGA